MQRRRKAGSVMPAIGASSTGMQTNVSRQSIFESTAEAGGGVGFGLFAAVLVYMIAGIANDSNVCTAPVFWGMLGLGLAVNQMLVKKENLFAKEPVSEKNDVVVEQNDLKTEKAVTTETSAKKQSGKKQSRKQRKSNKS